MNRPCFLILDRETSTSISNRKLVLETAKFNVITAYSSAEAIAILQKFPALDLVVTDSGFPDMPCEDLIRALKAVNPRIPVIVVLTPRDSSCALADYTLDTFEPKPLLSLIQSLLSAATEQIEAQNQRLEDDYYNR